MMAKVTRQGAGRFVTVYVEGEGKYDGVFWEVVDDVGEVCSPTSATTWAARDNRQERS